MNDTDHTHHYQPLPKAQISPKGCYLLEAFNPPAVHADSPALLVMTDLSQVPSATITADASLEDANQSMLVRGVRALFVVGNSNANANDMVGLVTSVDVLGEKAVLVAQKRQSKRSDLRVADVMVPVEQVEALSIEAVKRASVGNIVTTLKLDGRAHAIVVARGKAAIRRYSGFFQRRRLRASLACRSSRKKSPEPLPR